MTYDLKIEYRTNLFLSLRAARCFFFRAALRQLGAKRQGSHTNPPRRPLYEKTLAWRGLTGPPPFHLVPFGSFKFPFRPVPSLSMPFCPSPPRPVPFNAVRPSLPRPIPLHPVQPFSVLYRPSLPLSVSLHAVPSLSTRPVPLYPVPSLSTTSRPSSCCPVPLHAVPSLSVQSRPSPSCPFLFVMSHPPFASASVFACLFRVSVARVHWDHGSSRSESRDIGCITAAPFRDASPVMSGIVPAPESSELSAMPTAEPSV